MNVPFGSPVLDAAVRLLTPFILLFAAYVVTHGHYGPGGGFQGGVILAGALILVHLVRGRRGGWGMAPRSSLTLACAGVALYVGIGFLGQILGGNFLDYDGALGLGPGAPSLRAALTFGVEVGVGLTVMGVMVLLFDTLMAWEERD